MALDSCEEVSFSRHDSVGSFESWLQDIVRAEVAIEYPLLARNQFGLDFDPVIWRQRFEVVGPEDAVQFDRLHSCHFAEPPCEGGLAGRTWAEHNDAHFISIASAGAGGRRRCRQDRPRRSSVCLSADRMIGQVRSSARMGA